MKRFVNGVEVDLDTTAVEITSLADRLMVRTPEGVFSAVSARHGDSIHVSFKGQTYTIEKARRTGGGRGLGDGDLRAPMPGVIVDILIEAGASVSRGDKVLVLEAMKTQQPFVAPFDGKVASLDVKEGQQVAEGDLLARLIPEEASQ